MIPASNSLASRAARMLLLVLLLARSVVATGMEVDVEAFGAIADNDTVNTYAINFAIAYVSSNGGGTVHCRQGVYLVGRVELLSNVVLSIAQNSTLQASSNKDDWLPKRTWIFPEGCEDVHNPSPGDRGGIIFAQLASNVTITGGGTIDGAGATWNSDMKHRSSMFVFVQCTDVLVQNLRVQNSSMWTFNPMFSRRLTFQNLHYSEGPGHSKNTDGFDPYACEDVQFLDSYYAGGDDCVAIKSGKQVHDEPFIDTCHRPARNIVVDNITCAVSHGLTIGSEVSGGIENVSITNVEVNHCDSAVRIKTECGRGAFVRNVRYENITGSKMEYAVWIDQEYSDGPKDCSPNGTTMFQNIVVSNIRVTDVSKAAYQIVGNQIVDDENGAADPWAYDAIQDVYLSNVTVSDYADVGKCERANVTVADVHPPLPRCSHAEPDEEGTYSVLVDN